MIVDYAKEPKTLCLVSRYFASIARPRVRREALVTAARRNDATRFKSILSQCAKSHSLDKQLLRAIVRVGNLVYVAPALEINPLVYQNRALIGDLLREAIHYGHARVVKFLVGTETDFPMVPNLNELSVAVEKGHENIVAILLDAQLDEPIDDEWCAPAWPLVLKTALAGKVSILKLLLYYGVYPSTLRKGLSSKAAKDDPISEVIRLFAAAGLDLNARFDGVTPMHYALQSSNIPAFHALLDAGADIHALDDEQETLLHYAARYTESSICQILLDAGLDVNSKDIHERPPVRWALRSNSDRSSVIDLLLDAGSDLNHRNRAGDTLLHDACWLGNPVYADIFLSAGIDVDVKNEKGLTPVLCAVLNRDVELLSMLIGAGADMDVRDEQGRTAVDIATQQGDKSCLDILL